MGSTTSINYQKETEQFTHMKVIDHCKIDKI